MSRPLLLPQIPGVHFGEHELKLPASLSYEDWLLLGEQLVFTERNIGWWLGDHYRFGEHRYGEASAIAAPTGKALKTVQTAGWVAGRFEPSRRRESLSFEHHKTVASLPPSKADKLLKEAASKGLKVSELRERVHRERVAERMGLVEKKAHADKLYELFSVILADPPWESIGTPPARSPRNHYKTMNLEEIGNFKTHAADDAVLFLWTPNYMLNEALDVMKAWGFEYKTNWVWVKTGRPGLGYWSRNTHEPLLLGTRGNFPAPTSHKRFLSVINAPRGQHSAKPIEVYERIEKMYPSIPKLELFARGQTREGWAAIGDQVS